jgi:hypothetical protein
MLMSLLEAKRKIVNRKPQLFIGITNKIRGADFDIFEEVNMSILQSWKATYKPIFYIIEVAAKKLSLTGEHSWFD